MNRLVWICIIGTWTYIFFKALRFPRRGYPAGDLLIDQLPPPRATVQVISTPMAENYIPPSASMLPRAHHDWADVQVFGKETPDYVCVVCAIYTTRPEYADITVPCIPPGQ